MSTVEEVTNLLENASKQNEKELVIEFGGDRVLHYVGVYLLAVLAVVAKISELAGSNVACFPESGQDVSPDFIAYASTYCWETYDVAYNASSKCAKSDENYVKGLLRNPEFYKTFMKVLPYAIFMQAMIFSIPSAWWHIRVGGKLMGHLKFLQLLLNDIYDAVKKINIGIYRTGSSYDPKSYYLDDWNGYEANYDREPAKTSASNYRIRKRQSSEMCSEEPDQSSDQLLEDGQTSMYSIGLEKPEKESFLTRLLVGDMRDRHLFSMLCFENFSSMQYHPYILSVYKLSATASKSSGEGFTGSKLKGILRLLSNENNFGGKVLVHHYVFKHILGITISVIGLAGMITVMWIFSNDGLDANNFNCDVGYHSSICMTCTIYRKADAVAYIALNIAINLFYLLLAIFQASFIRRSENRALCYYFEEISDTGSAALR